MFAAFFIPNFTYHLIITPGTPPGVLMGSKKDRKKQSEGFIISPDTSESWCLGGQFVASTIFVVCCFTSFLNYFYIFWFSIFLISSSLHPRTLEERSFSGNKARKTERNRAGEGFIISPDTSESWCLVVQVVNPTIFIMRSTSFLNIIFVFLCITTFLIYVCCFFYP